MTFEELKEVDDFGAFSEFISVVEAKSSGIIPEDYTSYFPDTCDCGSDFIIRKSLTQVQCCNPRCHIKLGYMLAKVFSNFGCVNIGPQTCLQLMRFMYPRLKYKSHIEALMLSPDEYPYILDGAKGVDYTTAVKKILNTKATLSELVALIGIPSLEENGRRLFENYETVGTFLDAVCDENGLQTFMHNRGIHDALKVFNLNTFLEDIGLMQILMKNNVRRKAFTSLTIAVTGYVTHFKGARGGNMTRQEYVAMLNDLSSLEDGTRLIDVKLSSTVSQKVEYVVADYPTTNPKYIKGTNLGIIKNSVDLVNEIKEVVSDYVSKREQLRKQQQ